MKKLFLTLCVFAILGVACIAGDVRISAKSTIHTESDSSQETSWWDEVTEWVESLF